MSAASVKKMTNGKNGKKQKEFEETALVHLDLLYNSALQMTRNPQDAEDLIQETFLRAYRFFDKFERGTNCKAWLFKIMRNNYITNFTPLSGCDVVYWEDKKSRKKDFFWKVGEKKKPLNMIENIMIKEEIHIEWLFK